MLRIMMTRIRFSKQLRIILVDRIHVGYVNK